jgi:ABC-type glycerol-3-phosphate transport system substrate-binding protein
MKKTLAVLLAMCLTLGLIAFAGAEAIDTSEHVVITYMVTGDVPTNKTEETLTVLNEKLSEKANAELKLHWIEWTDYMSVYNLTLASQNGNIDLIGTATDWLDAWPNSINGAFMPLSEDMLKTYAPMTWAQVPAENWELCKLNGEIYLIPEDNYAQWTNHGFMYRGDWAAEAGLGEGVHSWDQLGLYFQYVKDNKEGVIPWDAKPDASIITQIVNGWQTSHTGNIFIEGMPVALFFGNSKDDPYTVSKYYLEGDGLVDYAVTMKQWADAGYWKEDVLNNTSIDTRKEMEQGLTGADQHHTQTHVGSERTRMEEYQPGSNLHFFWFGEETGNLVKLNITHGAMAIAATSKNPERALMVYDLIRNDEEIYNLVNYGVEGAQYVKGENMTFTRPEGYNPDTDGSSLNWWWGRNDAFTLNSPDFAADDNAVLTAAYDAVAINYPYGKVVFDLDPISVELDNLSNVFNTYMPQICFGKSADPAAYVAEFRQQLKAAGYENAIAEIEKQLAAVYGE